MTLSDVKLSIQLEISVCIDEIKSWMAANLLFQNYDKTEVMLLVQSCESALPFTVRCYL